MDVCKQTMVSTINYCRGEHTLIQAIKWCYLAGPRSKPAIGFILQHHYLNDEPEFPFSSVESAKPKGFVFHLVFFRLA